MNADAGNYVSEFDENLRREQFYSILGHWTRQLNWNVFKFIIFVKLFCWFNVQASFIIFNLDRVYIVAWIYLFIYLKRHRATAEQGLPSNCMKNAKLCFIKAKFWILLHQLFCGYRVVKNHLKERPNLSFLATKWSTWQPWSWHVLPAWWLSCGCWAWPGSCRARRDNFFSRPQTACRCRAEGGGCLLQDDDWSLFMMNDDDWWWLMMIDYDWLWLMMIDNYLWWMMMIDDDWLWLIMINDDWWWLIIIYDEWWWLMMIDHYLWWMVMIDDDELSGKTSLYATSATFVSTITVHLYLLFVIFFFPIQIPYI